MLNTPPILVMLSPGMALHTRLDVHFVFHVLILYGLFGIAEFVWTNAGVSS